MSPAAVRAMLYRDAGALLERIATLEERSAAVRARARRLARRRRRRHLVWWVLGSFFLAVIGAVVCVGLQCTCCITCFGGCYDCGPPGKSQAKLDMRTLHPIAEKWMVDHPGRCPTVQQLVREKEISPSSKLEDPWGHTYEVICDGDEVSIASAGADGRVGTADDFRVPDAPSP